MRISTCTGRFDQPTSFVRRSGASTLGLLGIMLLCAAVEAGTVKVGAVVNVGYNTFANLLLNFNGFPGTPGDDLTADGVSKRDGAQSEYHYFMSVRGTWPASTADPATWYKLTYHCASAKNRLDVHAAAWDYVPLGLFTVAAAPRDDGKGNWTAWLKFKQPSANTRMLLTLHYAADDLDERGLARHPFSAIKLLYPGAKDDDFISPLWKQRMRGFDRLRVATDALNGRILHYRLSVPGVKLDGRTKYRWRNDILLAESTPAHVQTQTRDLGPMAVGNMSWGKGRGAGNRMTLCSGKTFRTCDSGIGCLAPCELVYDLNGRFSIFTCTLGIDHEVDGGGAGPHGNVTFQVLGSTLDNPTPADYRPLTLFGTTATADRLPPVESLALTSRDSQSISVNVGGLKKLKLVMRDNGDPNGHVDIVAPIAYYISRWSDRFLPTDCCRSTAAYHHATEDHPERGNNAPLPFEPGLAYEHLVGICNALDEDLWISLPATAANSDDYLSNFGNLMLYGSDPRGKVYTAAGGSNPRPAAPPPGWHPPLKPNLRLFVEDDNEIWNWVYDGTPYSWNEGIIHGRRMGQQIGEDVKHMSDVLKPLFAAAGRADRLKIVFCNQTYGGWTNTDDCFAYLEKKYGPVNRYIDAYAEAPYFSLPGTSTKLLTPQTTVDDVFLMAKSNRGGFDDMLDKAIPEMAARAARWKLQVDSYEAGPEWFAGAPWLGGTLQQMQLVEDALHSRRMGLWVERYLQVWQAVCGRDAVLQYCGVVVPENPMAAIEFCSEDLKGTTRYDALMRSSHRAGDCNLDGKVDYADFEILAANFGGDGVEDKRWWSQGDFNNDQVVGLDDLKLLLRNADLKSWTPEQQQTVEKFLAAHPGPYVLGPDPKTHQGTWIIVAKKNEPGAISIPAREDSGGKPVGYVLLASPRHGRADVSHYPQVGYTPGADYRGIDDFTIAVKDNDGRQSNPVWVDVESSPPPGK